jgi:hypothetical protein
VRAKFRGNTYQKYTALDMMSGSAFPRASCIWTVSHQTATRNMPRWTSCQTLLSLEQAAFGHHKAQAKILRMFKPGNKEQDSGHPSFLNGNFHCAHPSATQPPY